MYITGSDQIWNTACFDFDMVYYLDFNPSGKYISYAPSYGPVGVREQNKNLLNIPAFEGHPISL